MIALLVALLVQVAPSATCTSVGLEPARSWRFEKQGPAWRVTHWRGVSTRDAASLSLPATVAVLWSKEAVSIKGRTSNGGIDVALAGTPALARLDIYVSYELEVNVDATLTPAIDEIDSDGPIGVRCEISPHP